MKTISCAVLLKISFIVFFSSCVSKKSITYFQNGSIDQSKVSNNYTTIFKPDDLLQITISAQDLEAVQPFNLPVLLLMWVQEEL